MDVQVLREQVDHYSVYVNVFGIAMWILLYVSLGIHMFPKELNYIHVTFGVVIALFLFNGWHCDDRVASLDTEMKMKDDVENVSARLCLLVATALFSTTAIDKLKTVPKKVKHNFMKLMSVAIVLLLSVAVNVSTPKKAEKVRKLRKLEAVLMNLAIALIVVSFVSMFHYL